MGCVTSFLILAHVLSPLSGGLCTLWYEMKLIEAIEKLNILDAEATIWVKAGEAWDKNAEVMVALEDESGITPVFDGIKYNYFLEVFIASEIIESMPKATIFDKTNRVIQYAVNDA